RRSISNEKGRPGGPPLLGFVVSLLLGAGMDVHLGTEIVRRRHLRQRRHLGGQRPVEGALGAAAEFFVDRRALGGAIGELGDHGVEVEALAAGKLLHATAVGRELRLVLAQELAVRAFVGAAAAGALALQGGDVQLHLQHAGAVGREVGIVVADGADAGGGRRGGRRRDLIVRCRRLGGRRRRLGLLPEWAAAQG